MFAQDLLPHVSTLVAAALAAVVFYHLYIKPNYVSAVRHLPGPENDSLLVGNLVSMGLDPIVAHTNWTRLYGHVYRYRSFFGRHRVVIDDPAALEHILFRRQDIYPKPREINEALIHVAGNGLLTAEGDVHRRMRKVSTAAFSKERVDEYIGVFRSQAEILCQRIEDTCRTKSSADSGGWTVLQMFPFLNRHSLAVVSMAGFGFDTATYEVKEQNLIRSLQRVLDPTKVTSWTWIAIYTIPYLPFLHLLPVRLLANMRQAMKELQIEACDILKDTNERLASGRSGKRSSLIDSLIIANRSERGKDRLSDAEVMAQVTTFLSAGNETVSTTVAWYLLELSKNADVQHRLRQEVQQIDVGNTAEIHSLPYLDAVTREVLRFHPAVAISMRASAISDAIPLSRPYVDASGVPRNILHVQARQEIVINVAGWNRSETIFGSDAMIFSPERWLGQSGENLISNPSARNMSVYRPLLSFIGGARSCIGHRFAVLEIKVAIATLLRHFEVDDTGSDFFPLGNINSRMGIKGQEDVGVQLPLRVRSLADQPHLPSQ